ncbi:hypothetical protein ACJW30_03G008100 [Castanea mollissima]
MEVPYSYVSVDLFSRKFKESPYGKKLDEELSEAYDKSQSNQDAFSFSAYSLSKWELFRICASREYLLMKRNSFIYIFKTTQLVITACITMTVFLWTRMDIDILHANYYMGSLFYALIILLVDAIPELSMTIQRLEVFYKQKTFCFYPAWAYAIPASILKVPISFVESLVWTCLTYYVIGYSPEAERFFRQFILLFAVHLSSLSMFRFLASVFQTNNASMTAGSFAILIVLVFSGFIITQCKMLSTNTTIGQEILESRGLNFDGYLYWISLGALFGFIIVFKIGYVLALTFLKSPGSSRAVISHEKLSQIQGSEDSRDGSCLEKKSGNSPAQNSIEPNKGRMVLPFTPLRVVFQDVQYYVDIPLEMREKGFTNKKLQILSDITGALKPGVLTALMGVSGAGKTTLLDVLAGRKTSGYIEGHIKIGGYPKVQETFARVSGYCEQTDIHSPQITVEESVIFSAWLRLSPQIDSKTKAEFVNEVLETIELDGIKDALVGVPGINGLSNEQRKRLTIAVELVSNPSIIFMDEPTTGLDARAAAIVMRAVKNVADTRRTIVCTIHQPSIDIFEAFDELILLKSGGHVIYSGSLGQHSACVIEYFESIPAVPKIRNNYNPATWMLEVTSISAEAELGVDFAQKYRDSVLYEKNMELVRQLSSPPLGSTDLYFPTRFSQNGWGQLKSCLWKQHLAYWRSPAYNLMRIMHTLVTALIFGVLYSDEGKKLNNQQNLFNIFGSMYVAVLFLGINNCSTVLPYVATERTIMYREIFAGMYSSWAYSLAQVIVEIPYLFIETAIFVTISYPMIGYYGSAYKQIPKWWIWMYYLTPTSWSLNGMLTSQYGDINKKILVFGETKTVVAFLEDYFGFHHDQLAIVAVVLIAFPIVFASLFSYFIGQLKFQRR